MDFLNEPLFIKWYLSHDCNLNCKSCYISKQSFDEITQDKIELVLKVIKNIAPIKVSLLGGEPTIFPHFKYILLAFYNLWKENSIFNSWRTGKYSEYLYNGQCPILELYKEK